MFLVPSKSVSFHVLAIFCFMLNAWVPKNTVVFNLQFANLDFINLILCHFLNFRQISYEKLNIIDKENYATVKNKYGDNIPQPLYFNKGLWFKKFRIKPANFSDKKLVDCIMTDILLGCVCSYLSVFNWCSFHMLSKYCITSIMWTKASSPFLIFIYDTEQFGWWVKDKYTLVDS
jgi:hypothetical protein